MTNIDHCFPFKRLTFLFSRETFCPFIFATSVRLEKHTGALTQFAATTVISVTAPRVQATVSTPGTEQILVQHYHENDSGFSDPWQGFRHPEARGVMLWELPFETVFNVTLHTSIGFLTPAVVWILRALASLFVLLRSFQFLFDMRFMLPYFAEDTNRRFSGVFLRSLSRIFLWVPLASSRL